MKKILIFLITIWCLNLGAQERWEQVPGGGRDIGVGANGTAWVLGMEAVPGGYPIFRRDGTDWTRIPGGAVSIDVDPNGNAWCVNSDGLIFRWVNNDWQVIGGQGRDIGIGANGTVWLIGWNSVPGGYPIFRWNGSGWENLPGGAVRIDVDPNGNAWCVNSDGLIFRWVNNDWQVIGGQGRDIGIGANGAVWLIGWEGGYSIHRWTGSNWENIEGVGTKISVDPNGLPWGTNSSGTIFHRVGSSNTNSNPAASSDLLTNGISETRFETVDGVVAYEYPNYRGRSHIFYQAGLHTAPFAIGSIKVPYGYSFFVEPDLENVNCHDLDGVGLADDWKDLSQYCETMRKITILTTPRSGKIEITLLQVNSTIHNEDCKRFYGKVSARALFNGGGLNSFSSWFRRNDMDFINWNRGLVRNILNYSETDVSNVEDISRIITVDEEVMNKTYLHFTTGLGSAHKSCDLCTDFTEDCFMLKPWTGIPNDVGNREFSILISEALDNEIVVLGPYNTTCGHSIWVKFRVRRL